MGATRWEASREIIQRCVRLAMTPVLNQMNVVGIVSIPGMMTGQILGGTDPSQARSPCRWNSWQTLISGEMPKWRGLTHVSVPKQNINRWSRCWSPTAADAGRRRRVSVIVSRQDLGAEPSCQPRAGGEVPDDHDVPDRRDDGAGLHQRRLRGDGDHRGHGAPDTARAPAPPRLPRRQTRRQAPGHNRRGAQCSNSSPEMDAMLARR